MLHINKILIGKYEAFTYYIGDSFELNATRKCHSRALEEGPVMSYINKS